MVTTPKPSLNTAYCEHQIYISAILMHSYVIEGGFIKKSCNQMKYTDAFGKQEIFVCSPTVNPTANSTAKLMSHVFLSARKKTAKTTSV